MQVNGSNIDLDNKEFQQALQIIRFTRRSLFLTGKAGTGKSTFLRYIRENIKKKCIVLAPTGISAINVGGSTLHSFFKIPFHPLLPNDTSFSARNIRKTLKYNGEKIKIIREVELIIIDEISMVRADIMDFIDKVLRIYSRNMREPFGGKQLLLVGDIYQLEPVVREEDRKLLSPYYSSCFFFDAHVFRNMGLISIELSTVYRQKDPLFIGILDHIRSGAASTQDLAVLNARTERAEKDTKKQTITLSTRRDTVDFINEQHLENLPGKPTILHGDVKGDFPESNLPTPKELDIKLGAQIIFVKNDMEHRWVNGTIGVIEGIDEETGVLYVITEDGNEYDVVRERWSNMKYRFNEKEQKIEEEEIGCYIQYPLRLAWAITIHKSQGLTFNNVNIDFSGGTFAGGQAYVALSRCKSLEGITLKQPIRLEDVFVRQEVRNFARNYNNRSVIDNALKESKADKEYHEAARCFDKGDYDGFIKNFFKAIHSRYDIEKPASKRLIRRKLYTISKLKEENTKLLEEMQRQKEFLKRLAVEYTLLGKECEKEGMNDAAIANYRKAIELCPEAPEPNRRLKKLES